MRLVKIAAGGKFACNKKDGVIGAVIKHRKKKCVLTAYHILKVGNCVLGDVVRLNHYRGRLVEIIWDRDLGGN